MDYLVERMERTVISERSRGGGGNKDDSGGDDDDAEKEAQIQAVLALSEIEKATLRATYPSRNTFTMDSGITFTS